MPARVYVGSNPTLSAIPLMESMTYGKKARLPNIDTNIKKTIGAGALIAGRRLIYLGNVAQLRGAPVGRLPPCAFA